jgi:hypothetical protein
MKTLNFLIIILLTANVNACSASCNGTNNLRDLQNIELKIEEQKREPAKLPPEQQKDLEFIMGFRKEEAWEAMQVMNKADFQEFVRSQVKD